MMTSQYDAQDYSSVIEGNTARVQMTGLDLTQGGAHAQTAEGDVFEALTQEVELRRGQDGRLRFSQVSLEMTRSKVDNRTQTNSSIQQQAALRPLSPEELLRRALTLRLSRGMKGRILLWLDTEKSLRRSGLKHGIHLRWLNQVADGLFRSLSQRLSDFDKVTIDPSLKYLRAGKLAQNRSPIFRARTIDSTLAPSTSQRLSRNFKVLKNDPVLTEVVNRLNPEKLLPEQTLRLVPKERSYRGQVRKYNNYEILKNLETMEPKPSPAKNKKQELDVQAPRSVVAEMEPSGEGVRANVISFAEFKRRKYAELKLDA